MKSDYEIIKDKYSERMAKACRTLFPTILEKQGELSNLLLSKFYPNPTIFEDLILGKKDTFKNYIYSFYNLETKRITTNKSVEELLDEAGYDFYECKSEEDIQRFKKYYSNNEAICTFDGGRLRNNYVFFAVKKNVDEIKREDFIKPYREDMYGTSVISIQFSKGENNIVSIKNRYNHTVENPDATFSNNLENIIPGLSSAFEKEYNLNINKTKNINLELDNYEMADDGKFYKYNYKIGNICYCPNNIIIKDGEVLKADSSRYKIVDYFLVDFKAKKIRSMDPLIKDSFCCDKLKRIDVKRINNSKNLMFKITEENEKEFSFEVDELSRILGIESINENNINSDYLFYNKYLNYIKLPNVKKIGDGFLNLNEKISNLNLNNVEVIGSDCLVNNSNIKKLSLPNVKKIGNGFLYFNDNIDSIFMPNIEEIGNDCFCYNNVIENLRLPNAKKIGKNFFGFNFKIKNISLPKLEDVDFTFFGSQKDIIYKIKKEVDNNARRINSETDTKTKENESDFSR